MTASRWLLPALLLLTACAEGSGLPESGTAVTDSAGVRIVRNGSAGVHGQLTAREVLRLGSLDDEGPARFRPKAVLGREVVGVWADDLDVEHILRFRVDGPAASS